jgi:hypothetical protein
MNNILLVNPRGPVRDLFLKLDSDKVKCYVVVTNDQRNFLTAEQTSRLEVYSPATLPADIKFVSVISSDVFGFRFREELDLAGRIILNNDKALSEKRTNAFLVGKPKVNSCKVIEVFSFFGRHVVSSAWQVSNQANYTLLDPFHIDNWDELVDIALDGLEQLSYANGPSQIFISDTNEIIGFKFQMIDWMDTELGIELTGRHWLSQYTAVVEDPNNQDKGFFKRFYEWSRSIGNNRSYRKLKDYSNSVT